MRPLVSVALLLLGLCASATAQRSHGYWFVAPGGITAAGHTGLAVGLGGGGEIALSKGVALGLEAGAVGPKRSFTENVQGFAALNGYYHFRPSRTARLDPFATVGYSLFFRRGTANLVNYGAGLNYWFLPQLAFRFEFRDNVHSGPTVHYWGLRMGLSFTELSPP